MSITIEIPQAGLTCFPRASPVYSWFILTAVPHTTPAGPAECAAGHDPRDVHRLKKQRLHARCNRTRRRFPSMSATAVVRRAIKRSGKETLASSRSSALWDCHRLGSLHRDHGLCRRPPEARISLGFTHRDKKTYPSGQLEDSRSAASSPFVRARNSIRMRQEKGPPAPRTKERMTLAWRGCRCLNEFGRILACETPS